MCKGFSVDGPRLFSDLLTTMGTGNAKMNTPISAQKPPMTCKSGK